jgi:transglutaminase-like putative cysteine protease
VQFRIQHESLYRYDVPVALGVHRVRLTPRPGPVQVGKRRLVVEPQPVAWYEEQDAYENPITRLEFSGTTERLSIVSEVELTTLLPPDLPSWLDPLPYAPPSVDPQAVYRGATFHPEVRRFADALVLEGRRDPVAFLDHLTRTLFSRIDRHIRPVGEARAAHETLALGSGACRDLTVLFLEVCRSQGLAARFVSGYQAQAQTPDGQRHLHAWAEVFLPGAGWRGWDATHGVRVTDGHVALCAAPHQAATMPIEGGFFFQGSTVNSTLDHSVRISTL